jgi:phage terminase Nu1 subunit (DNA packaging protein)
MRLFEEAYKNWLEEKARQVPNKDDLKQYTNALIDILFKLRNVHRLARLHDCETSEEALVLGHSNLGQF